MLEEIITDIEKEKMKRDTDFRRLIGLEAKIIPPIEREIIYPNQYLIDELSEKISQFDPQKIIESLKEKNGELYELLEKRGKIIKRNFENKRDVAKLNILLSKAAKEEKIMLAEALKKGVVEETVPASSIDANEFAKLANRCGILCSVLENSICNEAPTKKEKTIIIDNKKIWIAEEHVDQVEIKIKRIEELRNTLQVEYAKRHVLVYNEEDEIRYNSMQLEYLGLIKEKDEILKNL